MIKIFKIFVKRKTDILLIKKRRTRSPVNLRKENNEQQDLVDQFLAV